MEENKSKWQRLRERLRDTYRLIVMDEDSFEEVASYKLTLRNIYLLISSVLVILAFIIVMLVAFTPLRHYLPGGGAAADVSQINKAYQKITELEDEVEAYETYTNNIKKILRGNVETEDDVPTEMTIDADTLQEVSVSEETQTLIDELELEKIGNQAENNPKALEISNKEASLEQVSFVAPVNGKVSAAFNAQNNHFGVDILAPKNTAIKAAADGVVFFSDWTLETGNTIGIQHANNIVTFYKHNSMLLKKTGDVVKAGEVVAIIGNTGTLSSGPHLHFELWYRTKAMNPTDYISF